MASFSRFLLPKTAAVSIISVISVFGMHALQAVGAAKPADQVTVSQAKTIKSVSNTVDYDTLTSELQSIINQRSGLFASVAVYDLDGNKEITAGTSDAFTAASTTKVLTAVYFLRQVELGNAELDQDIDGESAQTLIQQMIQNSDNDAWHDLNEFLGESNKQAYAAAIGLSSYDADDNTITASDEALLLKKMYEGKLINPAHKTLLLSYMQDTSDEDLIPAALPSSATIYHKYGYLYGELHDAGIVSYKGHTFVLVIFTNNAHEASLEDYSSRVSLFHVLTDTVVRAYTAT